MAEVKSDRQFCIVCGAGETGLSVIRELSGHGLGINVVDRDPAALKLASDACEDIVSVEGNCLSDSVLKEAGLEKAAALFTVLPDDRSNVFLCLSAGRINPDLKIYAIASDSSASRKLRLVGARRTVNPNTAEGLRISSEILRPNVAEFLNKLVYSAETGEDDPGYICMTVPENSLAAGRTMGEIGIHQRTGVVLVAIASTDGTMQYSPTADSRLTAGDKLIAFGTDKDRQTVQELIEEQTDQDSGSDGRKHRLFRKRK